MTAILLSSAYINTELAAEFGMLPPSFLPIGNRRLYERQADLLRSRHQTIVLTVPENFSIPAIDVKRLSEIGITTLPAPSEFSIADTIENSLKILAPDVSGVTIMHGDTLFTGALPADEDIVSINNPVRNYNWAEFDENEKSPSRFSDWSRKSRKASVLSGYFCFSDTWILKSALEKSKGDFIKALNLYDQIYNLQGKELDGAWLDFGHVQTYHKSRRHITTERVFNHLEISDDIVFKTSSKTDKIAAEAKWFECIPATIKISTPQYLGKHTGNSETLSSGYQIGYEFLATLSDLFVFGNLPPAPWEEIFMACDDFLNRCLMVKAPSDQIQRLDLLYRGKAHTRIDEFCNTHDINPHASWQINGSQVPGLLELTEDLIDCIPELPEDQQCIMHGDFCFSNILYDFRRRGIKVIDPRGYIEPGNPSIYGDPRYDLAKLSHSVLGGYDQILAGAYFLTDTGQNSLEIELPVLPEQQRVREIFENMEISGRKTTSEDIKASTALLFLTMLPLHNDNPLRQKALLARGLMLASSLLENK